MSADIKVLHTSREASIKSVIGTLEEALRQANEGDVVAVCLAVVRPDGALNTAWSDANPVAPLLGGVSLLQSRLLSALDG